MISSSPLTDTGAALTGAAAGFEAAAVGAAAGAGAVLPAFLSST